MPTPSHIAAMERVCVAARAYRDMRSAEGYSELCAALDDVYPTTPRYRLTVEGFTVFTCASLPSLVRYAAVAFPGRAVVFESEVQPV